MTPPSPSRRRPGAREGCNRGVRNGHTCCSYLCDAVTKRQDQAERYQTGRPIQDDRNDAAVQNFWLVRYVERDPVWTHRPPVKVRHGG
jgi:hypothetical protein